MDRLAGLVDQVCIDRVSIENGPADIAKLRVQRVG